MISTLSYVSPPLILTFALIVNLQFYPSFDFFSHRRRRLMLSKLFFALSFIGASLAFPRALQTEQNSNMSDPNQIGTPTNQSQPTTPGVGGVFLCHHVNWMNCTYAVFPPNTCFDLNDDWNGTISSIGPDNGTLLWVYTEMNCTGNATEFVFPGSSNLMDKDINDRIVSINILPQTSTGNQTQ
ncbi:hypothetical protein Clacol_009543 [Clathrus columnatus]|uniref:Uncharacterized protein n=1 Tax=Clathrus columnatus TaxID=1419009 RepID=A0AAV5AND5_9AGAM|nr:hypothetical protein Clacol_009543 [Clathrus columnatus]